MSSRLDNGISTAHPLTYFFTRDDVRRGRKQSNSLWFFLSEPGVTPNSGNDATHLAPGSLLVSGKEVVFFEMEWPGFEPRTSSIRRGRSIHSTTPHLAPLLPRIVFVAWVFYSCIPLWDMVPNVKRQYCKYLVRSSILTPWVFEFLEFFVEIFEKSNKSPTPISPLSVPN